MAIHVALRHQTRYSYDRPVSLSPHVIRLRPAPHCRTPILSYSLKLVPQKHFANWQQDPHGNYLARVVFPDQTRELVVGVELVAEMSVTNPFDFFLEPSAEAFPFSYEPSLAKDLAPFLERLPGTSRFAEFVDAVDTTSQRTVDFLVGLNRRVAQAVRYIIRLEPGVQTPEETLTLASGSWTARGCSCRSSATSASPRASYPAISFSSQRTSRRSTARAERTWTSPTCTRGPRSTCLAQVGSGSTPRQG